ncbi:hypothetical protein SBA2_320046 [Acidobacteriia bacterium SbA2]|nr:hypothetical protein SBA2_320046 [Acidobacteriia bacterium SbA2]
MFLENPSSGCLSSAETGSRFSRQQGTSLYSVGAFRARDLPSCFCVPLFIYNDLGGRGAEAAEGGVRFWD